RAHEIVAVPGVVVGPGDGGAADRRFGIGFLDGARQLRIEVDILLGRARPEELAQVGLIPDFPVADGVVEAVGPTLVVVKDDVLHDGGIVIEVGRRYRIGALAAADPKQYSGADIHD